MAEQCRLVNWRPSWNYDVEEITRKEERSHCGHLEKTEQKNKRQWGTVLKLYQQEQEEEQQEEEEHEIYVAEAPEPLLETDLFLRNDPFKKQSKKIYCNEVQY